MKFRTGLFAAMSFALVGCSGTMQGVVRGEGTPVQFQYEQGVDRDTYRTNIDGESFAGQAINAGATSGVGTVFTGGTTATVLSSTTSGNL